MKILLIKKARLRTKEGEILARGLDVIELELPDNLLPELEKILGEIEK